MAKKNESLSPEEMLQNALVPDWEQPYRVPENWVWTRVGFVCEFLGGGTPSKSIAEYWNGDIPWASVKDIKGDFLYDTIDRITKKGVENSATNITAIGDLILITRIEPAKTIITNIETAINQDLKIVKSPIDSKFLHSFFQAFKHVFEEKASGSTVKGITLFNIDATELPLPPLAEQGRIVDRIESLFSKLNEAKEKVQNALDSFENRKAAILHKAFTGELTRKWREENDIFEQNYNEELLNLDFEEYETPYDLPIGWKWLTLNKCCTFIGSGVTPKGGREVYAESGIEFIRSQNVLFGKLDLTDVAYINNEVNQSMKRTMIKGQETLLNITGASIGRACYVPKEQIRGNVNQHVCILRFKDYVNYKYPYLWLISPAGQRFVNENQIGQTRQALNYKQIRGMYIPIPTPEEQTEIVRILDSVFEKEQRAKDLSDIIEKIDLMKKAILARAFRGELGTNYSEEESAKELLKSILGNKINTVPVAKEKGKVKKEDNFFILEESNVPKMIVEALSEHKSLTPEKLKAQTGIKDIDDFYAELKNLVDTGAVIERREGDESYLEVNDEGRQA